MPVVLHVGCGPKSLAHLPPFFREGAWREIRLDIDPAVRPDVIGTMTDMSAVPDASVDAVFSSHNIEHLYPHETQTALKEFRRVLKPDGFTLITCPDLQSVAKLVAEDRLMEPAYQSGMGPISPIDILYGHRSSMEKGNLFMAHRSGFTMRSLAQAIIEAGFGRVSASRRPAQFDLWALGTVAIVTEDEMKAMAARLLPMPR
jgi:ubiquinone/menaquinone biosynthesis C-methylase UbiE